MTKKRQLKRPDAIVTRADAADLAAYEWHEELDDDARKLWLSAEKYIEVRTANLATRIKPQGSDDNGGRAEPEAADTD